MLPGVGEPTERNCKYMHEWGRLEFVLSFRRTKRVLSLVIHVHEAFVDNDRLIPELITLL